MDFLLGSVAAPLFGGVQEAVEAVGNLDGTKNVDFVDVSCTPFKILSRQR